ncbi:MAG: endonuclease III domain-containing protein [Candidatus Bipolaricaulota bacterium]
MAERVAHRLSELYAALQKAYGPQNWWPADGPFEMMVGAVLTQATSWGNAKRAIDALKGAGGLSMEALTRLSQEDLATLIRPSGFFRQKAQRLKALVALVNDHGGLRGLFRLPTPELRRRLLDVPGVGPETADCILLYACGRPVFVVDAYTRRILVRLGLLADERVAYDRVAGLFTDQLPADPDLYGEFHALLVRHANAHCHVRPVCGGCPLLPRCEHASL